jgi:hypothetical protein
MLIISFATAPGGTEPDRIDSGASPIYPVAHSGESLRRVGRSMGPRHSNAKIFFQSSFMLITTQPCFFAWS